MNLELKVKPDVVFFLIALCMWGLTFIVPSLDWALLWRILLGVGIATIGFIVVQIAGVSFQSARTSVSPNHPEQASKLVITGVYRATRNPMYLGMALILVGWAFFLANVAALAGVLAFIAYISRFQIRPEERILQQRFGSNYQAYKSKVRRWI